MDICYQYQQKSCDRISIRTDFESKGRFGGHKENKIQISKIIAKEPTNR